ncbi:hypothetical protein [Phenylobacterium aquaticum]|uniref:hypothetical protein n=1 Tax=Phenylobacterium aquaticum TaxID=1763816 RepID=UPI0026ECDDD9|nr:hypothetical protein [Phenylobacterium aquaticum]
MITPSMSPPRAGLLALVALAAAASASPGLAKTASPPDRAAILQTLLDCRTKTDPQQRLACFDAATAQFDTAAAKGDVVVVDREQIRSMKRQAFGLTLPTLSMLTPRGGEKDEVDSRIEVVLDEAGPGQDGHTYFTFDDGAVWRQFDQSELWPHPKKGMKAVITRGAVGSFFLSLEGKPGVRVQRQR